MFKIAGIGLVQLALCFTIYGQHRYKDLVFTDTKVGKNILYRTTSKPGIKKKYNQLDLYEPAGDTNTLRPLIIWIHGGGYKFGNKKSRGIPLWSKTFAQRGYVCVAVNYRLSKKNTLSDFNELVKSCYTSIEDLYDAILFLKQNSNRYRIDTNRIIVAGNSAGGITALQAVYSSSQELAQLWTNSDAGILPFIHNSAKITAVINFWGAMFNPDWLKNASVPIVSVHGNKDRIVPFDHKGTVPFYGSLAIHLKADSLHIPNRLKTYEGYAHELQKHFNPFWTFKATRKRWMDAGQFAADFLYDELFKKE